MAFNFTETELAVLKNFSSINPSIIISNDNFKIKNEANSVIAKYVFEKPYEFDSFGIYNLPEFISVLSSLKKPEINVLEKFLTISDVKSKFKYFTTAKELIPEVAFENVEKNFSEKLTTKIKFTLTSEHQAMIMKTGPLLKAEYLYIETKGDRILMTIANSLEDSHSNFEIVVDEGIEVNNSEMPIKLPVAELKLFRGIYIVDMNERMAKFSNTIESVKYFIATSI